MKNPIRRLIHRYTYDMRLKTKLVISHIILILLPTAVLSGFFFLRIYDIVMKDSIRSEQVLSAQTVNSLENLISHVSSSSDTITNSLFVQDVFRIPTTSSIKPWSSPCPQYPAATGTGFTAPPTALPCCVLNCTCPPARRRRTDGLHISRGVHSRTANLPLTVPGAPLPI